MSAYIIVSYDVIDTKGYEAYVPGVLPLLRKHGAEVIVADYEAKALEGDRRSVYVVLRFESEKAALDWYEDPVYEPVRRIRFSTCDNNSMVLARQFVPHGR